MTATRSYYKYQRTLNEQLEQQSAVLIQERDTVRIDSAKFYQLIQENIYFIYFIY